MSIRYTFQVVGITGKKSGKCPNCGKRATRSQKFEQTINPFNKSENGFPKTAPQIIRECEIQRDKWMEAPTFHANCEYQLRQSRRSKP